MSVLRQQNWLGQQRIDVPHLRAVESSIAADFDVVAGRVQAGEKALVIRGFELTNYSIGTLASSLQLSVADGIVYNSNASESGTFLWVPADRAVEILNSTTNDRIQGSFTAGQTNYVGLDLVRTADDSTTDLVQFLDANTLLEQPRSVPLARTLDYKIVITTVPFSTNSNIIPVAKVVTNLQNQVSEIEDSRNLMFRLGVGGDFPNQYQVFSWPENRFEWDKNVGALSSLEQFSGGDKNIRSQKDWQDAIMTRLWELGGGQNWYSPTADRNVKMTKSPSPSVFASTGDNFEFVAGLYASTHLHWQGLKLVFDNSNVPGVYYNTVQDQLTDDPAGSALLSKTALALGECVYVDIDRKSNATVIARKANIQTLGTPVVPGSRYILAWRDLNGSVYSRDNAYPVNTGFQVATTTNVGAVRLAYAAGTPSTPTVLPLNSGNGVQVGGGSYVLGATGVNVTATGTSFLGVNILAGSNHGLRVEAGTSLAGVSLFGGASGVAPALVVSSLAGSGALSTFSGGSGTAISASSTGALPAISITGGGIDATAAGGVDLDTAAGRFRGTTNRHGVIASRDSGEVLRWRRTDSTIIGFLGTTAGAPNWADVGTTTNSGLRFWTNNTPKWGIDATGLMTTASPNSIEGISTPALQSGTRVTPKVYVDAVAGRNFIVNGDMQYWQRGFATVPINDNSRIYRADRWYAYASAGAGGANTIGRQSILGLGLETNFNYAARVTRPAGNSTTATRGLIQEFDRTRLRLLRGKNVSVSFLVRFGANFSGTLDVNLVTPGGGLSSGVANDNAFTGYGGVPVAVAAGVSITSPAVGWLQYSFESNVFTGVGSNQMVCAGLRFQHTPTGTAGADDWFEITGIQVLDMGYNTSPGPNNISANSTWRGAGSSPEDELALCRMYYEKSYEVDTAPGALQPAPITAGAFVTTHVGGGFNGGVIATNEDYRFGFHPRFKVSKYKTPTVNLFSTGAFIGGEFWAQDNVGSLGASAQNISTEGFTVYNNGSIGGVINPGTVVVRGHWTADAEI